MKSVIFANTNLNTTKLTRGMYLTSLHKAILFILLMKLKINNRATKYCNICNSSEEHKKTKVYLKYSKELKIALKAFF